MSRHFGVQTSTARKNHRSGHTEGQLTTTRSTCRFSRRGRSTAVNGVLAPAVLRFYGLTRNQNAGCARRARGPRRRPETWRRALPLRGPSRATVCPPWLVKSRRASEAGRDESDGRPLAGRGQRIRGGLRVPTSKERSPGQAAKRFEGQAREAFHTRTANVGSQNFRQLEYAARSTFSPRTSSPRT